jgi:hypothetical protein
MDASGILYWGDNFLRASLEGIPETLWETEGVCGVWSVKNLLAHLEAHEQMLTDVFTMFGGGSDTPTLNDIGRVGGPLAWNDWSVDQRRGWSASETLARYDAAYQHNMELAKGVTPEKYREVGTMPWYGLEYSLDDYIVFTFYGHKREHGGEIRHFRSGLGGT